MCVCVRAAAATGTPARRHGRGGGAGPGCAVPGRTGPYRAVLCRAGPRGPVPPPPRGRREGGEDGSGAERRLRVPGGGPGGRFVLRGSAGEGEPTAGRTGRSGEEGEEEAKGGRESHLLGQVSSQARCAGR